MINIDIDLNDGVSASLERIIGSIEDPTELNEQGARAANTAAIDYHHGFNDEGGWRGRNYLGAGAGGQGEFGQNIAGGWHFETADASGATISNDAPFYAHKVRGGTITPKGNHPLTIPMVQEASGRRVADYIAETGNRLFRIIGKKALFETKDGGGVRAVYALVDSVTQSPWDGALPDDEILTESFTEAWRNGLADIIERS